MADVEHELAEARQNRHQTWAAVCNCGCSWSSFPDLESLREATADHGELNEPQEVEGD